MLLLVMLWLALLLLFDSATPQTKPKADNNNNDKLDALVSEGLLVRVPVPQREGNLYLLGTVHLGATSARDARLVIETLRPSTVIVEMPPSRLLRLLRNNNYAPSSNSSGKKSVWESIGTLPSMAAAGLSHAGVPGMMVTVGLVWTSLVRQSLQQQQQPTDDVPRCNEFEAAAEAARSLGNNAAVEVVPADWELEELVKRLAEAMTVSAWQRLLVRKVFREPLGLADKDPIRRLPGESVADWERRRRRIDTARASREHARRATPELDRVLVEDRNHRFAKLCRDACREEEEEKAPQQPEEKAAAEARKRRPVVVCVVGLVHLEGIAEIIRERDLVSAEG